MALYIRNKGNFRKISYSFLFFFFIIGIAFLYIVFDHFFHSPINENKVVLSKKEFKALKNQINKMNKQIENLETIDEQMRLITGLEKIGFAKRDFGVGGTSSFSESDSKEDMNFSVNLMKKKIDILENSFNQIEKTLVENDIETKYIPIINPVQGEYWYNQRGFGIKKDPFTKQRRFHAGQDIVAAIGTPVAAAADGIVTFEGTYGTFGKVIKVKHGETYLTIYAHLHNIKVSKGQKVKRGEIIGTVGNSGRSTGPHLHYEVHKNGEPVNPMGFIVDNYIIVD